MVIAKLPPSALTVKSNRDIAKTTTKKKVNRSPLVRALMTVIRRSHLYFGLLLVPWAILYGLTAYLFNHPTHFSATTQDSIEAASIPTDWPTRTWIAKELAQRVVTELNTRFEKTNEAIQLDSTVEPKFEGTSVTSTYDFGGKSYTMSIAMDGQRGMIRSQPARKESPPPKSAFFEVTPKGSANRTRGRGGAPMPDMDVNASREESSKSTQAPSNQPLLIDETVVQQIKVCIAALAKKQGHEIEVEKVRVASAPELVFVAFAKDGNWECRHAPLVGVVQTKPVDQPTANEFSWRRFLLRLHVAHTYPDEINARWFWAIVVDLMAFVMVFWGVSGIAMWWQLKKTRPAGSIVMACSLVAAIALGIAMFRALS